MYPGISHDMPVKILKCLPKSILSVVILTNEIDNYGGEVKEPGEASWCVLTNLVRNQSAATAYYWSSRRTLELAYVTRPTFLFATSQPLRMADPTVINSIKSLNRDAPTEYSHRTCSHRSRARACARLAIPSGNCARFTFISTRLEDAR